MSLIKHSIHGLCLFILILGTVGCKSQFFASANTYSVKRVSDGDTLSVIDKAGNQFSVRFACIDAPEIPHTNSEKQSQKAVDKNQFQWGLKAKDRLQQLIQQAGDRVVLNIVDTDQYGRKVSEVRLPNQTFIQEVLVKEGLALVYTQYLKNCPSSTIVQQAEAKAKQNKLGVWGDSKFVAPWQYRRGK